ncbi:hypothetical protein SAMN05428642_102839 [Flaviramulus basaltis]|uniref:Uncharacterized protein n=1 Tax=Flaviramulus basaltis TaxID=369401 RepID=A0A1K2IJL5_9FLAO|nr:hypothetical protein [Flaviramulus basaltis]SFZ92633.1 hypothetical protein SAMN05428642_102839 [Flaviramulus basaltis]
MKEKADKYLDDLANKVIKRTTVQSPSFNFTAAVMSQVEVLNKKQTIVYKPLISKTIWVLISVGFLAIIIYALFSGNKVESTSWLNEMDFSALTNTLSSFKLSKTVMYAVVFFGFMICIQIPLLKNYFDKRLEM